MNPEQSTTRNPSFSPPITITILEESADQLDAYGRVSIAFRVESRLRVDLVGGGLGGIQLVVEKVDPAYVKDYDLISGEGPGNWAERWDISRWGILAAFSGAERVGGAAVAWDTPGVDMLEGRRDLAVLWDIRVAPEFRGRGVGRRLFAAGVQWARAKGCRTLKVETQNINVPACRFYARHGCALGAITRWAYPDLPDEVQLMWYLDL